MIAHAGMAIQLSQIALSLVTRERTFMFDATTCIMAVPLTGGGPSARRKDAYNLNQSRDLNRERAGCRKGGCALHACRSVQAIANTDAGHALLLGQPLGQEIVRGRRQYLQDT